MRFFRPLVLLLVALVGISLTSVPERLRNYLIDSRFEISQRTASGNIALVAIDPKSIAEMGSWPWSRDVHAKLLDQLRSIGAAEIFFDVDFSSPSNAAADARFAEALRASDGSVVLPSFKQAIGRGGSTHFHINRPLSIFEKHSWQALVNVRIDPDGLVRRYPIGEELEGVFVPSMGAMLAGNAETGTSRSFWIDFSIAARSVPSVSFVDVLSGDTQVLTKLKGKKIVVGATAVELGDRFSVPNGAVLAGPLVQILAAESLIQGRQLRMSSESGRYLAPLWLLIALLLPVRRLRAVWRAFIIAGIATSAEIAGFLVQSNYPLILDTSYIHLAAIAALIALAIDEINFRALLESVSERRFHQVAMMLGDGLVCTDAKGLIHTWNNAAAVMFGHSKEEMIGKEAHLLFAGAEHDFLFSLDSASSASHQNAQTLVELQARHAEGQYFPVEASISSWEGQNGTQYGIVVRDISERKRNAERIRKLAEFDSVTGLMNRHKFLHEMDEIRRGGDGFALLVIGIAHFRSFNDAHGHVAGDTLLCALAARLAALTGCEKIARIGDDFAMYVSGRDADTVSEALAAKILNDVCAVPQQVGSRLHRISLSIGIAIDHSTPATSEELIANAYVALSRARLSDVEGCATYRPQDRSALESKLTLESELLQAVERGQFELFYQPQFTLSDRRLVGAEALIRWRHPQRGLVRPDEFIPVINETALSERVGAWVLEEACQQASAWQKAGHPLRVSINLSPSQLQQRDFVAQLENLMRHTGISPSLIKLEVTENILLQDDERTVEIFRKLREVGVGIALDDFGTGYASLSYLKKFPITALKIDKSFVFELKDSLYDKAIVESTVSLCRHLGIVVIAEGIEDSASSDMLNELGCHEGQGYYFGRPMPASEFARVFLDRTVSIIPDLNSGPSACSVTREMEPT